MFPYHDENQTQRRPYITLMLIALNVLVWLFAQGAGEWLPLSRSVCKFGLIPGELTGAVPGGTRVPLGRGLVCISDSAPHLAHLLTSMFLHGSWLHLIGNLWFLWLFGNNVEDATGRLRFAVFYLLCGVAAALVQVLTNPSSVVPMVGASGAISGIMGGYLLLFPRVRVFCLLILGFFVTSVAVPAWFMLIYWFVLQFISGLAALGGDLGGVAFSAHVGGFITGLILVKLFVQSDYFASHRSHQWRLIKS
jgi:membrane associated rhomboid family serine protease